MLALMAASQPDAYARAVHRFATAGKLGSARNMLNWDAQTHMRPAGPGRAASRWRRSPKSRPS
ncbi:MAG: hypothetical protein WDM85_03420 [Caulobacteraceae bacterium]